MGYEGRENKLPCFTYLFTRYIFNFRLDESPILRQPQICSSHQVIQQHQHQVGFQASLNLVCHQKKELNHLISPHPQKTTKLI